MPVLSIFSACIHRIPRIALVLVLLLLAAASARGARAQDQPLAGRGAVPLAQALNSDGTLNLPPGTSASYDARGWELASGENEAPRFIPSAAGDEKWMAGFGPRGVNGRVNAVTADGSGNLYVAGEFSAAGTVVTNNIAKWDGSNWSALGYGLDAEVHALAWDSAHSLLYAGGDFQFACASADCGFRAPRVNQLAKWNGTQWSAVDKGVNGVVYALAVGDSLYVGGAFTGYCTVVDCGASLFANHVARWTGLAWAALVDVNNGVDGTVYALAWDAVNSRLYVGGEFTNAGTIQANRVVRWNGLTWSALNYGLQAPVYALAWSSTDNTLYAGGAFSRFCANAGCSIVWADKPNNVARYNASSGTWSVMGSGVPNNVLALAIDGSGNVYAGGEFPELCNDSDCINPFETANYIAKWTKGTPGSWAAVGSGVDGYVRALTMSGSGVYAGGDMTAAGEIPARGIAKFEASSWSALGTGNGIGGPVLAVAGDGKGNIYAGGSFHTAGGAIVNNVARWNGTSWSAMDYGINGQVMALAADQNGNVYAGGSFFGLCISWDCVTVNPANYIAKWDGSHWSAVSYGFNSLVYALAVDKDGHLYAGGALTDLCSNYGCVPYAGKVNHIAKWDGAQWTAVGFGLNGNVYALATTDAGIVYAGGAFGIACKTSDCGIFTLVRRVAQWDGNNWSTVGFGLTDDVNALAWDKKNHLLYAGGKFLNPCANTFCNALGPTTNRAAKWDGAIWSALGNGVSGPVNALTVGGDGTLFAGGDFDSCEDPSCTSGNQLGQHIAKWSGTAWFPLGSGIGPFGASVKALTWQLGSTFVGGQFGSTGDKAAASFGQSMGMLYLPLLQR